MARDESVEDSTSKAEGPGAAPTGDAAAAPTSRSSPSVPTVRGAMIGPYRVLDVLGEGGFGRVFLAERREPFVQRVAIKIIRPGMDSAAVLARFEQERQALAVMDHPNVARVLDGGATEPDSPWGGRPYFVMELVQGEPLTAYCDRHNLSIRARLELFIPVCEAVQHAHMKGIIHRDLKPSNILVSIKDGGQPTPKVIDFGVAKAISHTLTEKTIFTERGQIIGTPEYMSPEQAEMGGTDIDTRTDIYALGVVLYELLTGLLPFEAGLLRSKGYAEIQRIIREVEPPKPSTRVSTMDDSSGQSIAMRRGQARDGLTRQLRRELDWIPLKAMRKDRARRYATAADLAADVRRYLSGRPLVAAPESRSYLLRKFVRRNRVAVAGGAAVVVALAAGMAGTLWQARRAAARADAAQEARLAAQEATARATRDAERARVISGFLREIFTAITPDEARGRVVTVAEVLDKAEARLEHAPPSDVAAHLDLLETLGNVENSLGRFDRSVPLLRRAVELNRGLAAEDGLRMADLKYELGIAVAGTGDSPGAAALVKEAIDLRHQHGGPYDERAASWLQDLSFLVSRADDADALAAADRGFYAALSAATLGRRSPQAVETHLKGLVAQATVFAKAGRDDDVRRLIDSALPEYGANLPYLRSMVSQAVAAFADALRQRGHTDAARSTARAAVAISRERDRPGSTEQVIAIYDAALCLRKVDCGAEALALCLEIEPMVRAMYGPENQRRQLILANSAVVLDENGQSDRARAVFAELLAASPTCGIRTLIHYYLANLELRANNPAPARAAAEAAWQGVQECGEPHATARQIADLLARIAKATNDSEAEARWMRTAAQLPRDLPKRGATQPAGPAAPAAAPRQP